MSAVDFSVSVDSGVLATTKWQRLVPAALRDVLADALCKFPLPLVKIVLNYVVFATAPAGAVPKLLIGFRLSMLHGVCFGVACNPVVGNNIWASNGKIVQLFSDQGRPLARKCPTFKRPTAIAFASSGDAFVVDTDADCVYVCRSEGADVSVLRQIGSSGGGEGQFNRPDSVAFDNVNQRLFVADTKNFRVQILKSDGSFVRSLACPELAIGGIAVSPAGELAVAVVDRETPRVQVHDYDGKLVRTFGDLDSGPGQLGMPRDLAVDSACNWLVCDWALDRVVVFAADGTFVTAFGEEVNMRSPWSVCVDREGRVLVGQYNLIHVFAFAHAD